VSLPKPPAAPSRRRRTLEGILCVAGWMAAGLLLRLDANAYLLLGIPVAVLFQALVARRPLRELWVRGAVPSGSTRLAALAAAACGAWPAAYALTRLRRAQAKELLRCAAAAVPIGVSLMAALLFFAHRLRAPGAAAVRYGGFSLLRYFPACFVLEEVFFRGALDSHVHHPGESRGWASALLVSALWGLWHLPTVPAGRRLAAVPALLAAV
jgi:Type II CAAX prenyl endopeptidase Rce1-like